MVAIARALPIAVMGVSVSSGGVRTVDWYMGRNGVGTAHAPTITTTGGTTYGFTLTWPATYEDETGATRTWCCETIRVGPDATDTYPTLSEGVGAVSLPTVVTGQTRECGGAGETNNPAVVVVYGTTLARIEDYGGDQDKQDCETETQPYAAQIYRTLQGAQGSAMSTELTGWVHIDNLATARHYGWAHRLAEKVSCESNPGTADCHLDDWCHDLSVDTRSRDTDAARRSRAAAAYSVLMGATPPVVDAAVSKLLGTWFVRCWRNHDGSMTPAPMTYWPTLNPGPSQWDIGGGCWTSEHAHLVVEVLEPTDSERGEFLTLVNEDLTRLLDRLLPSHMTWSWCTNLDGGFRLDLGSMDYEGLDE